MMVYARRAATKGFEAVGLVFRRDVLIETCL
jgi:hypothetical protein